jgi:hypothetical protein
MLSVEERHPDFAQCCRGLLVGDSAYSGFAEIPFDLHRYRDGWHAYWKNPPNSQIGRQLTSRSQLDLFLRGNWYTGVVLRSPTLGRIVFAKNSSRRADAR